MALPKIRWKPLFNNSWLVTRFAQAVDRMDRMDRMRGVKGRVIRLRLQREVRRLPAHQRKKLSTWMVVEFPALSVDRLMARARWTVKAGTLFTGETPVPPQTAIR